jgi:hypothetical protein
MAGPRSARPRPPWSTTSGKMTSEKGVTIAKQGDRIRLLTTSDPHVELERGALGTVEFVDSMGTVHVRWDSGVTLGLVADEDSFELVDDDEGDD